MTAVRQPVARHADPFQRLVRHVQRQLAGRSAVAESKLLEDRITGEAREVDLVIESKVGAYGLTVSVECVADSRKASAEWVGQILEKHRNLPTNQLVLVSQSGFSRSAGTRAALAGVKTYTLQGAIEADWAQLVGGLERLFCARFDFIPTACAVLLQTDGGAMPHRIRPGQEIVSADGAAVATALQVAHQILNHHALASRAMDVLAEDGELQAEYEAPVPDGWFVVDAGNSPHRVLGVRVYLTIRRRSAPVELAHASWDDVPATYGSGETAFGSSFVTFVEPRARRGAVGAPIPRPGAGRLQTFAPPRPERHPAPRRPPEPAPE